MTVTQTRKERERAERHQRIIDTAREIAENDGWDAVTIRVTNGWASGVTYKHPFDGGTQTRILSFNGDDEVIYFNPTPSMGGSAKLLWREGCQAP